MLNVDPDPERCALRFLDLLAEGAGPEQFPVRLGLRPVRDLRRDAVWNDAHHERAAVRRAVVETEHAASLYSSFSM